MIGRVVGLSNSTFELKDGDRYISGNIVVEDYIDPSMNKRSSSTQFGPYNIPNNSLLVLGDNRDNSFDSRYFGHIPAESIIGKVVQIN